jgi:hypothetical protein
MSSVEMPSSHEDIIFVYLTDIEKQNKTIKNKYGFTPFLAGCSGFNIYKIFSHPAGDGTIVTNFRPNRRN